MSFRREIDVFIVILYKSFIKFKKIAFFYSFMKKISTHTKARNVKKFLILSVICILIE